MAVVGTRRLHHRLVKLTTRDRVVYARCSCGWRDPEGQHDTYDATEVWREHRAAVSV